MKYMNELKSTTMLIIMIIMLSSCNHTAEFNRIDRNDIAGYEQFIASYPNSTLVPDARERIVVAKENMRLLEEARLAEERQRQLESRYGTNSLSNGSQPYSAWYGTNKRIDDYTPHSEIKVKAPWNSDVIAIVRYNNHNGNVAGHRYVRAGSTATIYLRNGYNYQTFFYYGKGWYPDKEMKNGLKGGFLKGEAYSKDGNASYLDNNILTYELTLQENGNFQTSSSNAAEIF
jgi:hypothetical protein